MELGLLRDMYFFVAVARAKSFSRAADALAVPSSTLSRRVSALEVHLGLRLLDRNTRQLRITDEGTRYLERAESILSAVEMAHDDLRQDTHVPRGVLRLSMPEALAAYCGNQWVGEFGAMYPEISFAIRTAPTYVDPTSDNLDVCIRDDELESSSMIARRLASIPTMLFAAPAYLARAGTPKHPRDLVDHSCIRAGRKSDKSDKSEWLMTMQGRQESVAVTGRVSVENIHLAQDFALQGLGIARAACGMLSNEIMQGLLVPILTDWKPAPVILSALTTTRLLPARSKAFLTKDVWLGGRYLDRLQKRQDTWKILERLPVFDWWKDTGPSAPWDGDWWNGNKMADRSYGATDKDYSWKLYSNAPFQKTNESGRTDRPRLDAVDVK